MLYPKNFEEKIGFDKIRELLKEECSGTLGQSFVDKIRFSDNYEVILKLLRQTDEFIKIIQAGEPFPNSYFLDVNASLDKARIENTFLLEDEFQDLKMSLGTFFKCIEFLEKKDEKFFPTLKELCNNLHIDKTLLKEIERIIDDRGKVRNNASPELQRIRSSMLEAQNSVRKKLDAILKSLKGQNLVNEDTSLTIREGRMVIPLAVEYKRRIKGFVHDTSSSGQTVYIEPEEVLEINNEIRELEYEERREIVRILTALTDKVRPHVPDLKKAYSFLGIIDFIRAKAQFSLKIGANFPDLDRKPALNWYNAKHPLLFLNFQKQGKNVVPLNISLDEKNRILLISGPNAGGKSVCLKTVGLLQYMLQCGLLISAMEGAKCGIFENLFIDIGDEQSIENDLSTYSSHLKNMKHFTLFANERTLCLIDEFGTGTEPQLGGAIAEAILEDLNQKKAYGVITTHYANLKVFAENTEGVINGAMRYDVKQLEPLFELEIGTPGSSFALEIAQKIGLPRSITQSARQKVGKDKIDMEKLLTELELDKKFYREKNKELQETQKQLDKTLKEYEKLKNFLETNRKQLMNEAKAQAKSLLKEANQKIEGVIKEIKDSQAEKEKTKTLRKELDEYKENLKPEIVVIDNEEENPTEEVEEIGGNIEVGDFVKLKDQNAVGEVLAIRNKDVTVSIGDLKSTIKLNRLVKIKRKTYEQATKKPVAPAYTSMDMIEKMQNFSSRLDVRGDRAEEALAKVATLIDEAIYLNQHELYIVHGKGDGILRNLIREHLRNYKEVASMQDEHADRGGVGVTIVKLK
ncbi:endonuclease MutS2 [Thermoflexibacter ruber]|uniref:Endonuclease MutS2 n=1 Tax=Thermoflexibacter ruber TaxID=1003 RepID=A0A1I2I3I2_9BACT|nr:endonuclease MutS2 [Thermoflexibacter ruber]SFF36218.1 DNA mismatch repair protein MutS2 [Thermoflexibacter ruber]